MCLAYFPITNIYGTKGKGQDMTLQMGIIKVEIKVPELVEAIDFFKKNRLKAFEQISTEVKSTISSTFNQLLQLEMDLFLGKPDQSKNKRNGFIEREFSMKGVGCLRVRVPRDRLNKFDSAIIPKSEQIDPRLKQDLAVLHLSGISNRTLALISKRILGVEVSAQTVHNSLETVEEKALEWLDRKIDKEYWALFIDGTHFQIQRRGSTEKEPTLVVLGIDASNRMSVLALQGGYKDQAKCWETVFDDLIKRGLDPSKVQIGVMDGLPGLESEFKKHFTKAVTGRCWVHSKKNAVNKVPEKLSDAFEVLINKVMYASSESQARVAFFQLKKQLGGDAGRAVSCLEKDLESLLVHYRFEQKLWRVLKTTNPIERVNKELKRRTKSMEGLGEKTLNILLAFTAMRLEYNWQTTPVDSLKLNNLKQINQTNAVEDTLEKLMH